MTETGRPKKERNYWRIVAVTALAFFVVSTVWGIFAHKLIHPGKTTGQQTTRKVEITVGATANNYEGHVHNIYCEQLTEVTWKCTVRYKDGHIVIKLATWYAGSKSLGVSTIERR
jgi:hypothetical protein